MTAKGKIYEPISGRSGHRASAALSPSGMAVRGPAPVLCRLALVEHVLSLFVSAIEYDVGERASDTVRLEELSLTMRNVHACPDSHRRARTKRTVGDFGHDRGHTVAREEIFPRPLEVVPPADQGPRKRIASTTSEKGQSSLNRDSRFRSWRDGSIV